MTYKMTRSEVQALEQVLSLVITQKPDSMEDKLLISVMNNLYKKVVNKLLDLKPKYTLKIDAITELAFYVFFENQIFYPDYAGIIIKNICDKIEKQYV